MVKQTAPDLKVAVASSLKTGTSVIKKRKPKSKLTISSPKPLKNKHITSSPSNQKKESQENELTDECISMKQIGAKYPVLLNTELVKKFLEVTMTNNQKGRIRQVLKDNLKGTSDALLPDVIHTRIQAILKSSENLNETDLRKIRILYNMLKTAALTKQLSVDLETEALKVKENEKKARKEKSKAEKGVKINDDGGASIKQKKKDDVKDLVSKVKGPKRYVVFVGNLPLGTDKEKIKEHFFDIAEYIKDVRIPKPKAEKKAAIAYVELETEGSYELALSKNHTMMGSKRINVTYTTQQNSKVSKSEAKGKAAKLVALQKSGKLAGSIPLAKKRSQRRKKMKLALARQEKESE